MEFSKSQAGTSSSAFPKKKKINRKVNQLQEIKPTCFCRAGLQHLRYESDNFRHKIQMNALALADTTHTVGTLSVISEYHVFANSDDSASCWALLDINTRRVNLIEKCKPAGHRVSSQKKIIKC